MNNTLIALTVVFLLSQVPSVQAGGAVVAARQKQMMEERAIQEVMIRRQQQEAIRQHIAAQQQIAIQQYLVALKAAQGRAVAMAQAQQQRAVEAYMINQMTQQIAAYRAMAVRRQQVMAQQQQLKIRAIQNAQMQEAMMARQMQMYSHQVASAQALAVTRQQKLAEYQEALLGKTLAERAAYEQAKNVQTARAVQEIGQVRQVQAYQNAVAARQVQTGMAYGQVANSEVKEIVGISELWRSLDASSRAWPLVIDRKAKAMTVAHYIDEAAKEGGKIVKDPMSYVDIIDHLAFENPVMLEQPFLQILKMVAVIEYDYDIGVDKDNLARKIFPNERAFLANKQRLGL